MLPVDPYFETELIPDVGMQFGCLRRWLPRHSMIQYIIDTPGARDIFVAITQEVAQRTLPTPALTPHDVDIRDEQAPPPFSHHPPQDQEPESDSQYDQQENHFADPHDQIPPGVKQEPNQGGRPSKACAETADNSGDEQTCNDSQRSVILDTLPPANHNDKTCGQDVPRHQQPPEHIITASSLQQLDTMQHASKRKQSIEEGRASKRAHVELADATESGRKSSSAEDSARQTYEEFARRYYMVVPSSSRTLEKWDLANKIITKVLDASSKQSLDKFRLEPTTVSFPASVLAILENLRTNCLNGCAIIVQKNLRAFCYRRKYQEARTAVLLIQSIARGYLARKHAREIRRIRAATTIQRIWHGHKQRKSFNVIRSSIILAQGAARGFLRRRQIIGTCVSYLPSESKSSDTVGIVDKVKNRFGLSVDLQSKLQQVKSITALEQAQDFFNSMRNPFAFTNFMPDKDDLEQTEGPHQITASDRRVNQLKFLIQRADKTEKAAETLKMIGRIQKRVYLVELAARYMEETAAKKKGQPSVKDRFTDLLFPETIKYKREKASRGKNGKRGRQVSAKNGQQVSYEKIKQQGKKERTRAKATFAYWIRLGKPLWELAKTFSLLILVLLPDDLTEKSLHALRKGQSQAIVDYIDFCYPRLREEMSKLPNILPGIIAEGLPSQYVVVEIVPRPELLHHSFEELFKFCNPFESRKVINGSLGEPFPLLYTVDSQSVAAVIDPSLDPVLIKQPSHNGQQDIELAQSTSFAAGPSDETLGYFNSAFSEDSYVLSPQQPSVVWAGQTEYCPPGIAIEAWNEMQNLYSTSTDSGAV